jgi:hypothetical protein
MGPVCCRLQKSLLRKKRKTEAWMYECDLVSFVVEHGRLKIKTTTTTTVKQHQQKHGDTLETSLQHP